jgi:CubicO group peptidase (beta-lactamase class C family)
MRKLLALSTLVLFALTGSLLAAGAASVAFPPNDAGRRAAAFFEAFNSNMDNDMRAYLEANLSPGAIELLPIEKRVQMLKRIKGDLGTLEPAKLLESLDDAIRVYARGSKGGWVEIGFRFEEAPPHQFIGARFNWMEEPPDLDEPTTPLTATEFSKEIETYMSGLVAQDEFSGVVLVARGGMPLFEKAYGLASKEYGTPNRLDTRFNIGSINKIITRIAIEQLAGSGALALDDTIGKYLPDYPNGEAARRVTIRELLDMTSGIGDFFGDAYAATPKDRIRTLSDYLPLFAADSLLFEPGTDSRYSNGGYIVLGLIIEKVSGKSYFDYVRDSVYERAGMEGTGHLMADVPEENVASGYSREWDGVEHPGETRRSNIYTRPARGSSAGGGYSTARDLLKLALALEAGTLAAPETAAILAGGAALAGGAPGINAYLETVPAKGCTIIVLANYDPPTAMKVGHRIGNLLGRLKK